MPRILKLGHLYAGGMGAAGERGLPTNFCQRQPRWFLYAVALLGLHRRASSVSRVRWGMHRVIRGQTPHRKLPEGCGLLRLRLKPRHLTRITFLKLYNDGELVAVDKVDKADGFNLMSDGRVAQDVFHPCGGDGQRAGYADGQG